MSDSDLPSITPLQLKLDLQIAAEREIDGVGMGLLQRKFHLQPIDMPWRIRQLLHPAALNYFELGASKLSRIGGRRNSNRSIYNIGDGHQVTTRGEDNWIPKQQHWPISPTERRVGLSFKIAQDLSFQRPASSTRNSRPELAGQHCSISVAGEDGAGICLIPIDGI